MIIRFVGFGGQGIVMSSYIVGQSAVFDGKKAVQNQSYGSESRGGECRGDVIISDTDIYELEPSKHDVLVSMTQPGYEKFISDLKPGG
ncbi:MAG: 2-oxoacid:acceptor oxidoreductase family protein, partial [Candidatus Zixiibacteriota bacterium]